MGRLWGAVAESPKQPGVAGLGATSSGHLGGCALDTPRPQSAWPGNWNKLAAGIAVGLEGGNGASRGMGNGTVGSLRPHFLLHFF